MKICPPSSPDVTLASAHLALEMTWFKHVTLDLDHLLITISLPSDQPPKASGARIYTNFQKADWAHYVREVEARIRSKPLPTSAASGEKVFREVLLSAAKHSISAGFVQDCEMGLSREVVEKNNKRDGLRSAAPRTPL
jgi:hypothetical protein